MTTTAWGNATVLEEFQIKQSAEGRAFAALVQLLEDEGGQARRGPVTLRRADLERLRKALAKTPRLRAALALVC